MKILRPGLQRLCALIKEIRDTIGTPFYSYDWPSIESAANLFLSKSADADLKPNSRFYLAFFALPNVTLFKRLIQVDDRLGINCNTPEEVHALGSAGWNDWHRVVFSGGVLPTSDLLSIAKTGCLVNVAALGNLTSLLRDPNLYRIGLRIDFSTAALKGIREWEIESCLKWAENSNKPVTALHAYLGTEINNIDILVRHAKSLISIAVSHPRIEELNFGGGFWYDYKHQTGEVQAMTNFSEYFGTIREFLQRSIPDRVIKLGWEQGRSVFAGSGFFVTEIIEVREKSHKDADVYVDASFTQIPAPKIRNRQHYVLVLSPQGEVKTGTEYEARICGATTLSTDQLLPFTCPVPKVASGDLLIILDAGAYGWAGSYNFLGKARPPEILVDDSSWKLLRRRQRADHLLDGLTDVDL